MDKAQIALVAHVESLGENTSPPLKTAKAYRGQVKELTKLRNESPAAYIMYIDGKPAAIEPSFEFDILTCVDSQIYDREDFTNLSLAGSLARLLKASHNFKDSDEKNWVFLPENITAETVLTDPKHTIIAIHLEIFRG
ncbi:MAG: hypothetical protein H8E26_14190 [FCB group bacterium]|nr:hypothetical protein [FCB group bacterium]MBL7027434.1 hypothetical protein [Candidatus Neomarinimicrobiota bacterium]